VIPHLVGRQLAQFTAAGRKPSGALLLTPLGIGLYDAAGDRVQRTPSLQSGPGHLPWRREIGFGFATQAFADPSACREADRRLPYGEERIRLYGEIEGRLFVVVYTERQGRIRIISARRANTREIQAHSQRRTNASDA
jgi:uncharacterized DUF497 family protein